jgi:hypothetical protein
VIEADATVADDQIRILATDDGVVVRVEIRSRKDNQ